MDGMTDRQFDFHIAGLVRELEGVKEELEEYKCKK